MAKSKTTNTIRVLVPVFIISGIVALLTTFLLKNEKKAVERDVIDLKIGAVVPDFELTNEKGAKKKFSELKGKVTILSFWATWCGPCVDEIPSINRLRAKFKSRGLEVIGVNMDEDYEKVLPEFLKKVPIEFPIYFDPDGVLADKLSIGGLPFTVVIDANSKVLLTELGERDWMSENDIAHFTGWLMPNEGGT